MIYLLVAMIDMALILCSYFLASYAYLGGFLEPNQLPDFRLLSWKTSALAFLSVYAFLLVFGYAATKVFGSIYQGQIRKMAIRVSIVNLVGIFFFMSSFYVFNLDDASRILVFLFFVFSTLLVCFANWVAIHLFRLQRNSQKYVRKVLVVGCGHLAQEYAHAVGTRSSRLEHVMGYVVPYPYSQCPDERGNREIATQSGETDFLGRCLGSVFDIDKVFHTMEINEIVLALDVEDYGCASLVIAAADRHGTALTLVPFYNDIIPRKPNIDSFGGINLVDLRSMPLSNPLLALIKRFFDIVVSLFAIAITSWLMIITAIGVKISSPGPVFFKQQRIGKDNRPFQILKFRSMRVATDSDAQDDSDKQLRKTRFGSFIRKYSIDELPQFFNVLIGNMSIVGPRPLMTSQVKEYSENISYYMLRHQVRPGITGLAQISGFRGDTLESKRVECDIYYIQHWSLWLDIKIFFKTLLGGFRNDESLADESIDSRLSGTKFETFFDSIHRSAIDGYLGKTFNLVYLLCVFCCIFSGVILNPPGDSVPLSSMPIFYIFVANIHKVLFVLAIAVSIGEKRRFSFWFFAVLAFVLSSVIGRSSGTYALEEIVLFALSYPRTLKLDKVALVAFLSSTVAIVIVIASCLSGAIPDITALRGDALRHSMGFVSPNVLATTVTVTLIPYVYFRLHDWRCYDAAFCLLIGIACYLIAMGRMSFAMLLALVLMACICRFAGVRKALSAIAPWIVLTCFCATILFTFAFWQFPHSPVFEWIRPLFSGRLEYIAGYYGDYPITLFGQHISTTSMAETLADPTKPWRGMDCSYANILLRFGLIGSALMVVPTIWLGKKAASGGYTAAIFVILVISLFSITENFLYTPSQNFGIFIMGYFVACYATKEEPAPERASAPIERIDWVNMSNYRLKDFEADE